GIPRVVYSEFMGSAKSGRFLCAVLATTFALLMSGTGIEADGQTRKQEPHKKPATTVWTKTDCGRDVTLFVSAPASTQGSLLRAELRSAAPLNEVSGIWDERTIPFWQEPTATKTTTKAPAASKSKSAPQDIHRALLGVDLEKPAGTYDLTVSAKTEDATPVSCKAPIAVRAGRFATERLKVAPNF